MKHARAILWAQWRSLRNSRNSYPGGGIAWTTVIAAFWYGMWLVAAITVARVTGNPDNVKMVTLALPGGLLLIFLYWQVVPLLMAATGASLDLRKLQVYPIPTRQLFAIEVMLRVTASIEMFMVLIGAAVGILINPLLPDIGALAIVPYIIFNLAFAVGMRDLMARLLAHKRLREIAFLILVMCAALPQLFATRGDRILGPLRMLMSNSGNAWPWSAAANLALAREPIPSLAYLLSWCVIAAAFGLWQFSLSIAFDPQSTGGRRIRPANHPGLLERFYRLPSFLLSDPLGALVEKEVRFLVRSPRFRLVFMMGFTFGLVIWLPVAFGRGGLTHGFLSSNYLTVVSVYSLLLLSEVCFWNSFGFDRSAAQFYFLAPVPFSRVLIGKNLSAILFIALEIGSVTTVCAILGMPLNIAKLAEAFSVAGVMSILLLGAGNILSVRQARGVNPDSSFRSGAAGRLQAILLVVYPIAFLPAGLAYLARWAFDSEAAFFAVLAFDAAVGMLIYKLALDSAVAASERTKEAIVAALSAGDNLITG
jgi:ABC-2 type transport system permease protein